MTSHGHGCDGDHDHDETPEMGLQYSLFSKIDMDNVECLNESVEGSGKHIFKPWEERLNLSMDGHLPSLMQLIKHNVSVVYNHCNHVNTSILHLNSHMRGLQLLTTDYFVESDADEELLINIPFTGNVKLKGILVIGGETESHPSQMKLYKNRPKMTFDDTSLPADQTFDLHPDSQGTLEYSTMVVKFSSVYHLTIHFPRNFGADTTRIYYVGLRGEFTTAHRHGVTICSYEAQPSPADHKTESLNHVNQEIQ